MRTITMPLRTKASLHVARKRLIDAVTTEFIICLDYDTILPEGYIEKAIEFLMDDDKIGAVALDYEKEQGHLAFGTSVWRTEVLRTLYDWHGSHSQDGCECRYMWKKVKAAGFNVLTFDEMRAIHLKCEDC